MTHRIQRPRAALIVLAALAAAPSAWCAPRYHLVDLGANTSGAFLQDDGVVTGFQTPGDVLSGVWRHGHWRWYPQSYNEIAVSRYGDAVAVLTDANTATLRLRDGSKRRLTVDTVDEINYFVPLADDASALAQVTFFDAMSEAKPTCGYWGPGQKAVTLLPITDGTGCYATGIAADGRVVGSGQRAPFQFIQAFTWTPGGSLQFISPPGDTTPSFANAVNRLGHIALQAGLSTQAAWFDGTQIHFLGNPPGTTSSGVTGINAADEMVGVAASSTSSTLWYWAGPAAAPVPLASLIDDLGGLTILADVASIDDLGEILVNAVGAGVSHAVLLQPIAGE